jgi:hypothetical protein
MEIFARNKAENEKAALQQRILELEAEIEQRAEKNRASEEPVSHHGSTTQHIRYNTIPWLKSEDWIWFFKCLALGPCFCAIHDFFF